MKLYTGWLKVFFWMVAISVTGIVCASGPVPVRIRVERTPVAGGAELITWFERLPDGVAEGQREFPILSVLNDTLLSSESADDRLRQVWIFTSSRPSPWQRIQGTIPFFYHRLGSEGIGGSKRPHALLDMGVPHRGIWSHVAMATAQAKFVNPAGALPRLTTRSYGGNLGEYRTTHIWEALDVISPVGGDQNLTGLTNGEFEMLHGRLQLSGRMFSGLVSDKALLSFYDKYQISRTETRGHNWELLRQSAEENGLYFQPLTIGGMANSFAMVWVARDDLTTEPRHFESQFLKITNPFDDDRLRNWKGYSRTWDLDGRQTIMIPLALYSLDYPRVPLLLVDFRREAAPRRAEMTLRIADDLTAGVLGLTTYGFGNLGYVALKSSWLFVNNRHGGATSRAGRRRAFVQLRHALGADDSLDPEFRKKVAERLGKLDIDPMERSWEQEVRGAWRQYNALMQYAADPKGLPKIVVANRQQEAGALAHGPGVRGLLRAASIGTFGLYHHQHVLTLAKMEQIAEQRREALLKRTPAALVPAPQRQPIPAGAGQ